MCRHSGKTCYTGYYAAENSNLYAVASRNKEKAEDFQQRFKADHIYADYEELLNDKNVNSVYIPLPNSMHLEWVKKAVSLGKNVLCEKPLGLNQDEVRDMITAAQENNVLLMEAFMYRFHPMVKQVREMVEKGLIGEVRHVESHFTFTVKNTNNIRLNKELGGGALYDIGCYTVNSARYITGKEPVSVYNKFKKRPNSGIDDHGAGILIFSGDLLANVYYGLNAFDNRVFEVTGTKGRIYIPGFFKWDQVEDKQIFLENLAGNKEIIISGIDHYQLQIEEFSEAIINNKEVPLDPVVDSINNFKVLDAMFRSAENGREEEVV